MSDSYNPYIDKDDFKRVLRRCGYSYPENCTYVFQRFSNAFRKYSLDELAMVLAQLIHESGGFHYREERRYAGVSWHDEYRTSLAKPGKLYHGRGYIQLTWPENYLECSQGLGRGDLLLRHPEFVSERIALAMFVSEWYWRAKVRPAMRRSPGCFGATTRALTARWSADPVAITTKPGRGTESTRRFATHWASTTSPARADATDKNGERVNMKM